MNPSLPEKDISMHQEASRSRTYGEDGAKLHLHGVGLLEAPHCPLMTMMTMLMMTVRVDRHDNQSRSNRRPSMSHAVDILDGRVGLRAVVDRRGGGSHL